MGESDPNSKINSKRPSKVSSTLDFNPDLDEDVTFVHQVPDVHNKGIPNSNKVTAQTVVNIETQDEIVGDISQLINLFGSNADFVHELQSNPMYNPYDPF